MRLHFLLGMALVFPAAAGPHEHGVARLDLALDGGRLSLAFATPLDNLVGFERAPRNDAERRTLDAALARLRDGAALWQPETAARCTLGEAEVLAPRFAGTAKSGGSAHADVESSVGFVCQNPAALGSLQTRLFEAFPRLKRIEVQLATPRGQARATLRPGAATLKLPRAP